MGRDLKPLGYVVHTVPASGLLATCQNGLNVAPLAAAEADAGFKMQRFALQSFLDYSKAAVKRSTNPDFH